jgi:hypothetical protein
MSYICYAKSVGGGIVFDNKKALMEYLVSVDGKPLVVEIKRETGVRSSPQNRSLHLYYEHLAQALNEGGLTVKKLLEHTIDLEWSGRTVKELIWRPIQIALTGKESTADLDKVSEIDLVYDHINRFISTKGIHVPFPSELNKHE